MEIGLVAAFLGGALALLSPCGALLLPAYFASRVGHGSRRLVHGLVFYLGIAAVLVPLGAGAGVLGRLFATHREAMVIGTAAVLVITGIAQAAGWGFDVSRVLPGARSVQTRAAHSVGIVRTFLLGAVGGVAGFCAGPILGAVLTVAAAQDDVLAASSLLAAYAAGIVAPMLVLAATWDRLGTRGRSVLRGRAFRAFGRMWHSTSVITGALMITLGAAFWATNGLVSAPSLVPADAQASLQAAASSLTGPGADVALIVAATAAALLAWRHVVRRRAASVTATASATENETAPDAPPDRRSAAGSARARRDT
ncbi:cytochrome c biogenesis CcdA family protein [Demequina muriae]|uniref:Cytochrome c biogenesis CcdA family protein n=1 Tax=Demequina muriae TaxID=3051664 RepID=A0ABT8GDK2_9MICO|nr:cytochrome c biogenesis CcdA family protein [Demequina sp. EGI L300058]MDN4479503.1 cytochrome c biogenesis CcdA family protein [Demequina sp. EGI L300058]